MQNKWLRMIGCYVMLKKRTTINLLIIVESKSQIETDNVYLTHYEENDFNYGSCCRFYGFDAFVRSES